MEVCRELGGLIGVDDECRRRGIFVAYTIAWRVAEVDAKNVASILEREVAELRELIAKTLSLEELKSNPIVRAYRDFLWSIGVDPTKTRPSSEALVRRILRGSFPRINPVVDAGNIASARTLVPIGIYDLDRVAPPLIIRLSRGGEKFNAIGGKTMELAPGIPIMVDSRGVVLHVYPHRDSVDTCVTPSTQRVLIVGAGVRGVDRERVECAVREVVRILELIGWSWCRNIVVA